MKKNFTFRFLISIILLVFGLKSFAQPTFVSLSPALTEIMYALDAQNMLKAVSTACNYPLEAQKKDKIGDNFFINDEKIIKIKPDYILALDSSETMLAKYKKFEITPLCFKYPNIESIYKNILFLGKLTGKEQNAQNIVNYSRQRIKSAKVQTPKKILYLIQTKPMITIGNKSFITDIIRQSGNISVTQNINSFYPTVLEEYIISQQPDIIIVSFKQDTSRLRKIMPKAKIVIMTQEENDIVNRPGVRVYKSVEIFAKITQKSK